MKSKEEIEDELVRRMTAAMREADRHFETVGGSTRHHVRDCLLPILEDHGLKLELYEPKPKSEIAQMIEERPEEYAAALRKLKDSVTPMVDAIERSTQLTAEDLNLQVK